MQAALDWCFHGARFNREQLMMMNPSSKELSELIIAVAKRGYFNEMSILIDAGVPLESTDNDDLTPLHWVCIRGHPMSVPLLLDASAHLVTQDSSSASLAVGLATMLAASSERRRCMTPRVAATQRC